MKRKTIWLVASCLIIAVLFMASCASAVIKEGEKEAAPEAEQEVVTEEEETVSPTPESSATVPNPLSEGAIPTLAPAPENYQLDVSNFYSGLRGELGGIM